jgi:hypothetical protein
MPAYKVTFVPQQTLPAADLNTNFQALIDSWFLEDDLTANVDGIATVFTTTAPYVAGKLRVYVDGLKLQRGVDFTESGSQTFTLLGTPLSVGQRLLVEYQGLVTP